MKQKKSKPSLPELSTGTGLIGKFFHTRNEDRTLKWQGYVESLVEPGYYLILLYSWLDGSPNGFKLVLLDDMLEWDFYNDNEHMREVAEREHRMDRMNP